MKFIQTVIAILITSSIALSQNKELKSIYCEIDSILKKEAQYYESNNQYSRFYCDYFDRYGSRIKNKFNRKYEIETLIYLEKYMYDSLLNIQRVVSQMVHSVGFSSKNIKTRQHVVNILLQMFRFPYFDRGYIFYSKPKDVDDKAKERLKELISEEKSKFVVELYSEYYIKS